METSTTGTSIGMEDQSEHEMCTEQDGFPLETWHAFNAIINELPPENIPDPPVAMLPWLYLAPLHCVRNNAERLCQEFGITHVLSTNRMPPQVLESLYWELRSNEIEHHYIPADDQLTYDMMAHWDECKNFLQDCRIYQGEECDEGRRTGKALVHCAAGMNRSGTIVAAAMMHFGEMDLLQVARELKAKRGYALSNSSFVRQLINFALKEGHLGKLD
jgi:hypothetical protein